MTPTSFLKFRDRLAPASGFGSGQFREVEIVLGQRERHYNRFHWDKTPELHELRDETGPLSRAPGGAGFQVFPETNEMMSFRRHSAEDEPRLIRRMLDTTLRDLLYWLLNAVELRGPNDEAMWSHADQLAVENYRHLSEGDRKLIEAGFLSDGFGAHKRHKTWDEMGDQLSHAELISATYVCARRHEHPGLNAFLEACLRLDSALLTWRDMHIRFVERMIGARPGTGGGGVSYLAKTTDRRQASYLRFAFPCLWEARSFIFEASG